MKFGFSEDCLAHDTGDRHPETPERLLAIKRGLKRKHGVEYVDAPAADEAALCSVHEPGYVEQVREFCEGGGGNWDADTVAVTETWSAALASAGLAQWTVEAALAGSSGRQTPFSLGRPPGHHAVPDDAMGFCFFNNAAVAAQHALDQGLVERVAVVDWDVHHGNGTQNIFYDRGDVLYASIHEEGLYPGTGEIDETGTGDGAGATVNIPFPAGSGDAAYLAAFDEIILPAVETFDPGIVLVSAGFDAHEHDPISRMRVTSNGFGLLTERVRAAAEEAALAFVLEGGYGLDTLSDGVAMVHEVFDGFEPVSPDGSPTDAAQSVLDKVAAVHGLGSK